jgi:hypothetical protein
MCGGTHLHDPQVPAVGRRAGVVGGFSEERRPQLGDRPPNCRRYAADGLAHQWTVQRMVPRSLGPAAAGKEAARIAVGPPLPPRSILRRVLRDGRNLTPSRHRIKPRARCPPSRRRQSAGRPRTRAGDSQCRSRAFCLRLCSWAGGGPGRTRTYNQAVMSRRL